MLVPVHANNIFDKIKIAGIKFHEGVQLLLCNQGWI